MSNAKPKVLITGANGGLGSSVVHELLKLLPADDIAISVRDPDAAERFIAAGIRARRGDFDDPQSLDVAFEGAERVLIISTRNIDNHARFLQQRTAIDAARRCGARHVYYTSVVQRPGSVFDLAEGHHQTEDYLDESGIAHTIFCNGHYIENLPMFLGMSLSMGILSLPEDGPTAWVSRQDLAEGIARVMRDGTHGGERLTFTGPEALDFTQIADAASEILGIAITRRTIDATAYINSLVSRGLLPSIACSLASGFESRAAGELAAVEPALANVLGRPPRTVRTVLSSLLSLKSAA